MRARVAVGLLSVGLSIGCQADKEPAPAALPTPIPVIQLTAADYSFSAPDTLPAGWVTLQLRNEGTEMHHVQLVRLDEGKTVADLATLGQGPPPSWLVEVGGANPAVPGGAVEGTVHLTPGNYAMLCMIPSPDGQPHLMKGMVRPVVVAGDPVGSEPTADVVLTLTDYGFAFSKPLVAGRQRIKVVTAAGIQPHEAVLARVEPGKTAADLVAWSQTMVGPPPGTPLPGAAGLAAGQVQYVDVDLTPGNYALLCFMPDHGDGKPHVAHGMMLDFEVK